MNKRIILIGLIVILASFIIGSVALPNALSKIANFTSQNVTILAGHNAYASYFLNETGFMIIGYQSNSNLDFYFVNQSAFNILNGYMNSTITLAQWARNLKGNGVLESITNSSVGIFPYTQFTNGTNVPPGSYIANNTTLLDAGNYYAIFQNVGNSSANVNITSDVSTNIKSQGEYLFGIGVLVFLIFVAGVCTIIYGIIKKPKNPDATAIAATADPSKKVDELYKGVDKKGKGKAKK